MPSSGFWKRCNLAISALGIARWEGERGGCVDLTEQVLYSLVKGLTLQHCGEKGGNINV
jgi:hypothetical protein